jgi:hypothetical protein
MTGLRLRIRVGFDMLLTLVIAVVALVLVVGYQVLGRWGHRWLDEDEEDTT